MENLFQNAKYPERIYVGICEQNKRDKREEECVDEDHEWRDHVRILKMNYEDAKGPTYARFLCSLLYQGEDFFLQIDSHTLFVKNWDMECIPMIKRIERKNKITKVVLSYYPDDYEKHEDFPKNEYITYITKCEMNENGILMLKGAEIKKTTVEPSKNYFIGANFLFTRGQFLKDVPFDPFLPYLFMGEEILLSARSYTSGYDIYTPNKNIVYHLYTRSKDPKYWDDIRIDQTDAQNKVKILLGFEKDRTKIQSPLLQSSIDVFGLGKERTLEQYYKDSGLDTEFPSSLVIERFCIEKKTLEQQISGLYTALIILIVLLILLILIRIMRVR
jgi:hypothetical protein